MKCERCGHELDNDDLFCSKCGKAVFEEYMDEDDIWEFYKSDEELKAMKMEAAAAADKDTEDSAHSVAAAAAAGYEKSDKAYVSENQREGNGSGNVDAKAADAVKADYDAGAKAADVVQADYDADSKAADVVQADYDADSKAADAPKADYDADVKAADAVIADHNIDGSAADSENTDHEETDYKAADPVSTEDSDAEYSDADIMDSDSADTEELPFENLVSQAQKSAANKPKKEKHRGEPEKKSPIWLISGCILIVCLLIGILWGVRTMQQMDEEKKAYYAKIEPEDKTSGAQAQNTENKQDAANKDTDSGEEADKDAGKKDSGAADADKKDKDKEPEKEEKPKEEKKEGKKEEKKQEYFKQVDADSIDFSKFQKVSIASADQNSQQSSEKYDYSAASAVDGDTASSWQEGEDGLGEGTGIRLDFDKARKVRYMVLYLGNWRSENMWEANARPASLTISVGDSQKKDVEFSDEMKAFCLSFDEPVEASYVSLYIKSGYEGDRWNDNCISEVEIYE